MLIKRFCLGKSVFVYSRIVYIIHGLLEVMDDHQLYRFEPERVPNPEDSESENEEVNDR